jgi:hypothetical protein
MRRARAAAESYDSGNEDDLLSEALLGLSRERSHPSKELQAAVDVAVEESRAIIVMSDVSCSGA